MKDRKINFQIQDVSGHNEKFQSLRNLYDFIKSERDFWSKRSEQVNEVRKHNNQFLNVKNSFDAAAKQIEGWESALESRDENQLNQQLQHLKSNHFQNLTNYWLWSGNPAVTPFIKCLQEYGDNTANAFMDYVLRKNIQNLQHVDYFKGYLLGYEFDNQESSITKRRNGEKVSLGHLRNQFVEAKDKLFTEVDDLKADFSNWESDNKNQFERLYNANKYLGERRVKHHDRHFDEKLRTWSHTINELEKTYEEKLKLSKPAEYWRKAARRYGIQGSLWSLAIVALVVVGLIYFREFFLTWLSGQETGIKLSTIQGAILFGSFAAVYAYLLRVISRLAFSAFHLMRDAEEREQLTYLYLSLINESAIDNDSRDIVLQALFSRSETGLLAQEHGPTMPIADALKAATKGGGK